MITGCSENLQKSPKLQGYTNQSIDRSCAHARIRIEGECGKRCNPVTDSEKPRNQPATEPVTVAASSATSSGIYVLILRPLEHPNHPARRLARLMKSAARHFHFKCEDYSSDDLGALKRLFESGNIENSPPFLTEGDGQGNDPKNGGQHDAR